VPLPDWFALTVQVPMPTGVTVVPETVQMVGVAELKTGVRPDGVAVAATV
jgi:hypothetical protein